MRALALAALVAAAPIDAWIAPDKAAHAGVGFVLSSAAYLVLANDLGVEPAWKRALGSTAFALAIGAGKELAWDWGTHGGDPSWRDFAAGAVGAFVGAGLCLLVDHLVHARGER